ncbi:sulfur carrier protein ThiS [Micrococcus luteus]|uniref:sulfur carrier protein ThiS n=1 Tax=Micrococcus luteus TaxID=1270 RepID=UPI000BA588F6|nr:sulfur carrier protein ThiS [Micrococcus luteus]PAL18758.1 thiamine biosynthesis protein ThiS [Micrococcus luteus]
MSTLTLTLNGEPAELAVATVRDVVAHVTGRAIGDDDGAAADGRRLGVAVAVGGEVVPRSAWATRALAAGDEVDVVTAVQGG